MISKENGSHNWLDDTIVKVGEFVVDFKQTRIYKDEIAIKLEPLTMELLCYLTNRKGHYVSQRELLEHVWNGRIVSDNAIRRVIKKLRDALGDDVKAARYIKTVPNKGYLLIAEVSYQPKEVTSQPTENTAPELKSEPDLTPAAPIVTTQQLDSVQTNKKVKIIFFIITSIIIFLAITYYYPKKSQENATFEVETLTDMPGEEYWADYNKNNNIVVFSHRKTASGYYNLYLKSLGTETVRRITSGSSNNYSAKWSKDGRKLAFQRQSGNQAEIILMSFDENMKVIGERSLYKYKTLQPNLFWSADNTLLYFTNKQSPKHPKSLFSIKINTGALKQITFPDVEGSGDYSARLSPDGNYLGILRFVQDSQVHLLIVNMITGKIEDNKKLKFSPVTLAWDHESLGLYLADGNTLYNYKLNDRTLSQSKLADIQLGAVFTSCGSGCLLANSKGTNTRDSIEVINPFTEEEPQLYEFPLPGKEGAPTYSRNPDQVIFRSNKDGIPQLIQYSINGELKTLTNFTRSHKLVDITYNPVQDKISGILDHQVFILDLTTNKLQFISNQMEKAERLNWSADGLRLYYTRREHNNRSLIEYNLQEQHYQKLRAGVKEAKEDKSGQYRYLLLETGELIQTHRFSSEEDVVIANITTDSNVSWHIYGDYLYFSSPLGTDFLLNRISLSTKEKSSKLWLKNTYYAWFDMHPDGNKLLLMKETVPDSNLLLLKQK